MSKGNVLSLNRPSEVDGLLSKWRSADDRAEELRASLFDTERAAAKRMVELRESVGRGATTGDQVIDFCIMYHRSAKAQLADEYRKIMSQLQEGSWVVVDVAAQGHPVHHRVYVRECMVGMISAPFEVTPDAVKTPKVLFRAATKPALYVHTNDKGKTGMYPLGKAPEGYNPEQHICDPFLILPTDGHLHVRYERNIATPARFEEGGIQIRVRDLERLVGIGRFIPDSDLDVETGLVTEICRFTTQEEAKAYVDDNLGLASRGLSYPVSRMS